MNFPTKSGGPKDEQFEFIAADILLRRFIIELQSARKWFPGGTGFSKGDYYRLPRHE
jgi:hypothetical protein